VIPSDAELSTAGIGGGDYVEVGDRFLDYFKTLVSLAPHDTVLEIGCGIGRMARPLAGWLQPPGRYEGFDVVPASIAWCQAHVTPTSPHFRFQVVDIANSFYNPRGRLDGKDARFPFDDATFDVAIAVSLFTHVLPDTARRYMSEVARVLKPSGRLFATWFLWPPAGAPTDVALKEFPHARDGCRVASTRKPEAVVSFSDVVVGEMYTAASLRVTATVGGNWSAGVHTLPYQDMIVAVKA
jgi:SAM-dependent methyltransferase